MRCVSEIWVCIEQLDPSKTYKVTFFIQKKLSYRSGTGIFNLLLFALARSSLKSLTCARCLAILSFTCNPVIYFFLHLPQLEIVLNIELLSPPKGNLPNYAVKGVASRHM